MTLDPAMKKVLEIYKSMNLPKLYDMKIDQLRSMMSSSLPQESDSVKSVEDLSFSSGENTIPCRLYTPENPGKSMIIYFHGGGFIWGGIESSDPLCRRIANISETKVLSVGYRHAPENKFPSPVDDGFNAFLWACNNSEKLGIDRTKIVLAGDSSGGNIAATTCLKLKDTDHELPMMQVLFYPFTGPDFFSESMREFSEGYFLTQQEVKWIGDSYLNSRSEILDPYFAPVLHEHLEGLPEALIVTAEYDPLRDQGEMYASRLYSAGVPVTSIRANGMIHGFTGLFTISPAANSIITMVYSVVRARMK